MSVTVDIHGQKQNLKLETGKPNILRRQFCMVENTIYNIMLCFFLHFLNSFFTYYNIGVIISYINLGKLIIIFYLAKLS